MNRRTLSKLLFATAAHASVKTPVYAQAAATPTLPSFSVMLWTLTKQLGFGQALEVVAKAGYRGVELVGEFQHWSPEETRGYLDQLRSLGLTLDASSGVKAGFAVPAQKAEFLAQFRQHLASLHTLGCRRAILLSGPVVPGMAEAAQRLAAVEALTEAAGLAAEAQVEIVIEPIDRLENPGIFLQSVAQAFPIVKAVNKPNVKVLYDLYHEQRGQGNLLEKLEGNLDLVSLIHIADVPGRHEPGTGEIRFEAIYRELAELRYSGWIAMEFYPTGDPLTQLRSARLEAEESFHA